MSPEEMTTDRAIPQGSSVIVRAWRLMRQGGGAPTLRQSVTKAW